MWARIVCGEFDSSTGLNTQPCRASVGTSGGEMPQECAQAVRGIVVGRTSGEVMHEGAVRVMAKGAGGRPLPVTRGTACGGKVMAPARKPPKTKGRGRQVEGVHRVLPDR